MRQRPMYPIFVNPYEGKMEMREDTHRYFTFWIKQNSCMNKRSHDYKLLNWVMVF